MLLIWELYYAGLAILVLIPFCIDTIVLIMFHCVGLIGQTICRFGVFSPVWIANTEPCYAALAALVCVSLPVLYRSAYSASYDFSYVFFQPIDLFTHVSHPLIV